MNIKGHIESSTRSQSKPSPAASHLLLILRTRSRSFLTLFAGFTSFSLAVQAIVQIRSGKEIEWVLATPTEKEAGQSRSRLTDYR